MCELFELGKVLDIINDKENKTITIIYLFSAVCVQHSKRSRFFVFQSKRL